MAALFANVASSYRSLPNVDLLSVAIGFGVLLVSLTIHEAAHALTADRLGDPTARRLGRVSLNPMVHIDLIGTIILPLLAIVSHLPLIGWAKPVPVDTRNLRHPQRDFAIIAAAGPVSNLLQAIVAAILYRVMFSRRRRSAPAAAMVLGVLYYFVQVNLLLAFFNLIPVPPLDGGNVLLGLLPPRLACRYAQLRQYGFLILYALMLTGVASALILPPTEHPAEDIASVKPRVVSGMRPTGKLHLGHLVGALNNWAPLQDQYDCFYFVADWHALTSDYADTSAIVAERLRHGRRLDRRRPRSREEHALRPVARARARRAVPAAVDDRADPVARARADLQGADRAADATRICRRSASSAIRCCRPPTSSSTTRSTCRSARTRCRTSS